MRISIAFTMVAACGFSPNSITASNGDAGRTIDSEGLTQGSDAHLGSDAGSGSSSPTCYGTYISVCPKVAPSAVLSVSTFSKTFDTGTTSTDCIALDPANDAICVVAGTSVAFGNTVAAHGARPLVVLSLDTLDVSAALDVGSHGGVAFSALDHQQGPDSDPSDCTGTGPTAATGAGYGGSFGSVGGTGNGTPGPIITPTTIRGGCPGGAAKNANAIIQVGHGGGAVLLIAHSISVMGSINASGQGGGGGVAGGGGYGGGAGGMIVLDSPSITVGSDTMIYANGGGGGGGGAATLPGGTGSDPSSYKAGGDGGGGGFSAGNSNSGGDGGDGATNVNNAPGNGDAGDGTGASGAGGGGFGVIKIFQATGVDTTHFSPPPT